MSRAAQRTEIPRDVASMFDGAARESMTLTSLQVLSLGQDLLAARPLGRRCGSGPAKVWTWPRAPAVSTVELAVGRVVCGCRFFGRCLRGERAGSQVASDATRLPFGDDVFDAVTIQFRAFVTSQTSKRRCGKWLVSPRPGGRLLVCGILHAHQCVVRRLQRILDAGAARNCGAGGDLLQR